MEKMTIDDVMKMAQQKADEQERRGTSAWHGVYYGYIFGFQKAFEMVKPKTVWGKITLKK